MLSQVPFPAEACLVCCTVPYVPYLTRLTPLEPQSRFGYKLLEIRLVCPQNGTAVLKRTGGSKARFVTQTNAAIKYDLLKKRLFGPGPPKV